MRADTLVSELRASGLEIDVRASADTDATPGLSSIDVLDVEHDSRRVLPGSVFCAVPGTVVDGHDFVAQAVASGAVAVLVDHFTDDRITQLRTSDVRRAMPHVAAIVHQRPSASLDVVGITGTNGKTTTTHLFASVLRATGRPVEVIGTLSGVHTTPEAPELQRRLRHLVDAGVEVVAAEISSHALDQHRADAVDFAVAAFSNLTPDHLDYHLDMDRYFEAKARLFDGRARHELVNVDDEWGARLAADRPEATQLSLDAVTITHADLAGTTFEWRGVTVSLPLPGRMNVANALMAAEAAIVLGVPAAQVADGLREVPQVPGRMEIVANPFDERVVVVDYSHTPDSISRAIATLRASAGSAPLSIVFGCGGDRDRTKRPLMAQAAEAADHVIITSDNPRSEDPQAIIDDALVGITAPERVVTEPDRRAAIRTALDQAHPAGVVLIAGKGHETTQTIGAQVLSFSDVEVARELLEETAR